MTSWSCGRTAAARPRRCWRATRRMFARTPWQGRVQRPGCAERNGEHRRSPLWAPCQRQGRSQLWVDSTSLPLCAAAARHGASAACAASLSLRKAAVLARTPRLPALVERAADCAPGSVQSGHRAALSTLSWAPAFCSGLGGALRAAPCRPGGVGSQRVRRMVWKPRGHAGMNLLGGPLGSALPLRQGPSQPMGGRARTACCCGAGAQLRCAPAAGRWRATPPSLLDSLSLSDAR